MKTSILLFVLTLLLQPMTYAASPCSDEDKDSSQQECANDTQQLPESAQVEVEKLRVEMRFLIATGHATKAEERKNAITEIYQAHGLAVPEGLLEF